MVVAFGAMVVIMVAMVVVGMVVVAMVVLMVMLAVVVFVGKLITIGCERGREDRNKIHNTRVTSAAGGEGTGKEDDKSDDVPNSPSLMLL